MAEGEGVVAGDEGCVWWRVREKWGEWWAESLFGRSGMRGERRKVREMWGEWRRSGG